MKRIQQIPTCLSFAVVAYSCRGQVISNVQCKEKLEAAKQLACGNSTRQSALDSAMAFLSVSMECDKTRKAAIDVKITLLASMKKYAEGIVFIDVLDEEDFTFSYKKPFLSRSFKALQFENNKDTFKSKQLYQGISNDLEQYIRKRNLGDNEFNGIYSELFAIKRKYSDKYQVNLEAENLGNRYPEKRKIFDVLKDIQ